MYKFFVDISKSTCARIAEPINIFQNLKLTLFPPGARAAFKGWFLIVLGFSGFQDSGFLKFQEDGEVKSCFVYCLLFVFVSQIHEFFSIAKILSFQNEFECHSNWG